MRKTPRCFLVVIRKCKHMTQFWSNREGSHVSAEVRRWAVLSQIGLLCCCDVFLLLLDPVGGDVQHQTLQGDKNMQSEERASKNSKVLENRRFKSHLQMMPAAGCHFLSPVRQRLENYHQGWNDQLWFFCILVNQFLILRHTFLCLQNLLLREAIDVMDHWPRVGSLSWVFFSFLFVIIFVTLFSTGFSSKCEQLT